MILAPPSPFLHPWRCNSWLNVMPFDSCQYSYLKTFQENKGKLEYFENLKGKLIMKYYSVFSYDVFKNCLLQFLLGTNNWTEVFMFSTDPFPHTTILQQTILKSYLKKPEKSPWKIAKLLNKFENIVAKEEIAHHEQCYPWPQCLQK